MKLIMRFFLPCESVQPKLKVPALNHAVKPSLSRLGLGNQILHKTDLKLVEECPKIIILKSDITAMYQIA
jgi:hypothetical protein